MRERGSGRIIMISSMYGRAAVVPFNGWYHASKFGLEGLSDVLRMEVAGFGVKVSIIEPGVFKTEIDARAKEAFGHRASIATSPYQGGYERSERMMGVGGQLGLPADLLARVIVAAVESRRPLRRYLVGVDAMALVAAQAVLPRAVLDASARFMMGLG
jgi:NAD(P)-dependent dehydrogenase (short-subunit alcohol dehydrogenase family)